MELGDMGIRGAECDSIGALPDEDTVKTFGRCRATRTSCRFGNLRYSRLGSLRYVGAGSKGPSGWATFLEPLSFLHLTRHAKATL